MSNLAKTFAALCVGTLFGAGLAVSQMMNPAKVLGFLDVAGAWDPTLAFVMGGALIVTIPAFALTRKRKLPLLGGTFDIPTRRDLDMRLIGGSAIFGLGWGIAGFCPGPALAALGTGIGSVAIFVLAMMAGMFLHRLIPLSGGGAPRTAV